MNTFLNFLVVAFVFVLLALPSLIGHARDLRIDRQIRRAGEARGVEEGRERVRGAYGRAA
ncbi:hypothetical protein ACIO3O_12040 [Streptomyces sp. NPDC087440]|uniref:hypothetical protein n=1 Tax=Streptomyces sp. NPDC087440 TaxID=3365790 RepID=UPI003830F964